MQKRFFAISLLTTALLGVWWNQPTTNAAELPKSATATPATITPPPLSTSQPANKGVCLTKSVEPPKQEKHTDKASVNLGQSFVIPKEVSGELSHIPAVNYRLDGEKLFTVTNTGQLLVWSNASKKIEQQILLTHEPMVSVVLDPRGCFAAWSTKSDFYLLALGEKHPMKLKGIAPNSIALSPKNDTVALAFKDRIELRSTRDASLQRELTKLDGELTNVSFSPDGATLGVTTKEGSFSLLQVESATVLKRVKKIGAIHALAFSPDGKFVAYGGDERIVYQMELTSYKEEVITQNQPYWITALSYSPDSEMIAFGDESCDVWLFRRADKKNLFHSKHHNECWLNSITWTPDSEAFIFGCRPNTYAGKPAIYLDNHLHEANNDSEVVRFDQEIEANNKQLDALLSSEALAPYRERLSEAKSQTQQANKVILNHNNMPNAGLYGNNANSLNNVLNVSLNNNSIYNNNVVLNGLNPGNGRLLQQSNEAMQKLLDELETLPNLQTTITTLRSLHNQRNSSFEAKVKLLNESFCVNQWVITR